MAYRVRAVDRGDWPGRYRSGRFFPKNAWTELKESEMTEAILADPYLVVVPKSVPVPKEAPGEELLITELQLDPEPEIVDPLPASDTVSETSPYLVGAQVLYTSDTGSERKAKITALNDDGTYALSHGVKHARAEQLRPMDE